jgi:hypothetical protein
MYAVIKSIETLFAGKALRVATSSTVEPNRIFSLGTEKPSDHVFDTGLQIKQSPPISIPFRFFLTAPIFLFLIAVVLLWRGPEAMQYRLSPAAIAVTHLFTLGFMSMVMLGALLQLLPVVAGAPVTSSRLIGSVTHLAVTVGTLSLCAGFLFTEPNFVRTGMVLLVIGFMVFAIAVGAALLRSPIRNALVGSIKFSVAALVLTISFGTALASSHAWNVGLPNEALRYLHPAWGLLGWGALLAMGVAFRVVPMFQLTSRYPSWLTRTLPPIIVVLLMLWSTMLWMDDGAPLFPVILAAGITAAFAIFAVTTLLMQHRRKGGQLDITVYFWQLGMASLLIATVAALFNISLPDVLFQSDFLDTFIGVVILFGFFGSIINGMLYKIVPFLVWFRMHAVAAQNRRLPNVKAIIPERRQRLQLMIHVTALLLLSAAPLWTSAVYPAALAIGLSACILETNYVCAILILIRR